PTDQPRLVPQDQVARRAVWPCRVDTVFRNPFSQREKRRGFRPRWHIAPHEHVRGTLLRPLACVLQVYGTSGEVEILYLADTGAICNAHFIAATNIVVMRRELVAMDWSLRCPAGCGDELQPRERRTFVRILIERQVAEAE